MTTGTAKAAVFRATGKPLEIAEFPLNKPKGNLVRLLLKRSGICGTDLHILHGRLPVPPPFIPGHEFVGQIDALGPNAVKDGLGNRLRAGDFAIACVADPCGTCFSCRQGLTANCLNFGVTNFRNPDAAPHLFGGFAEALYQPAANLVRLPRGLDLDAASAFPCAGPTSIHAFTRAGGLQKGELVIVQGAGPVGLFAVAWAAAAGCAVGVVGSSSNPARLALAKRLGAKKVWDYRASSPEDRLAETKAWAKRLRRGDGADVVFEASGAPTALPEGLNLARTCGRYVVPGQYSMSGGVEIQPQLLTFKALSVVGSGQYTLADIATYLRFLRKHRRIQAAFAACVTHRYAVADANAACAAAAKGVSVKAVFSDQSGAD